MGNTYVQKHKVQYTDIATQRYNKDHKQSKLIATITDKTVIFQWNW